MISGLENPIHLLVILLVVALVFGGKRLPELGRSLGTGIRGFKHSLDGPDDKPPAPLASVTQPATEATEPRTPTAA